MRMSSRTRTGGHADDGTSRGPWCAGPHADRPPHLPGDRVPASSDIRGIEARRADAPPRALQVVPTQAENEARRAPAIAALLCSVKSIASLSRRSQATPSPRVASAPFLSWAAKQRGAEPVRQRSCVAGQQQAQGQACQREARIGANRYRPGQRVRRHRRCQPLRRLQAQKRQPLLARQQPQIGLAQRRQVLAARRGAERGRGRRARDRRPAFRRRTLAPRPWLRGSVCITSSARQKPSGRPCGSVFGIGDGRRSPTPTISPGTSPGLSSKAGR